MTESIPSWKRPLHARHLERVQTLRQYMTEKGTTSKQMAKIFGIHHQSVRRYMSAYRPMPLRTWKTLKRLVSDPQFSAMQIMAAGLVPPVASLGWRARHAAAQAAVPVDNQQ